MSWEKYRKVQNVFCSNRNKVTNIDKDCDESVVTISWKIKCIDSANLWQVHYHILLIISQKEFTKLNVKIGLFFWIESVKYNLIRYKCLSCNKSYSNKIDEEQKKLSKNTFKLSNNAINKFILSLRKGVYPYEYIDEWEEFNETALPEKE